jgi:hypothetical protein
LVIVDPLVFVLGRILRTIDVEVAVTNIGAGGLNGMVAA